MSEQKLSIQPFGNFHLYDKDENWENVGGRITYVRIFGIVGVLVLFIACINFMNLCTARSEKRAKEFGIRKSVGSQRKHLIIQILGESAIVAFLAFLLSIGLIFLILPYLEGLGFENIKMDMSNSSLWISGLAVCILTGRWQLSGFLPIFLSTRQPNSAPKK